MVANKNVPYPDQELFDYVVKELDKRGIDEWTVGNAAYAMQHQYYPDVTVEQFGSELTNVLKKREVLNNLAVGFALDNFANRHLLPEPLQTIVANDLGAFGVDEALALSITQLYGTVSSTNYGHADKEKIGFAKELDNSKGTINTFSDDLFSALASAVCARFAHGSALQLDESTDQSERIDDHIKKLMSASQNVLEVSVKGIANHIKGLEELKENIDTNVEAEPTDSHGWTYGFKRKDDDKAGEDSQEIDSQSVSEATSIVKSNEGMSSVKLNRDGLTLTLETNLNNDEPIDWDNLSLHSAKTIWQKALDEAKQRTYEAIDAELSKEPMFVHLGDMRIPRDFQVTAVSPENETPNHKYIIVSETTLFNGLSDEAKDAVYCLTYEELYDAMNDLYNAYPDDYGDVKDIRKLMKDAIETMIQNFEDDEE